MHRETLSSPAVASDPAWHQLPAEEVVQLLETDLQAGLAADEVRRRHEALRTQPADLPERAQ